MDFNQDIGSSARFERMDSGKKVDVFYNHQVVPADPKMQELMPKVISKVASSEEKKLFGELWQERVRKILIDFRDDERVCEVREV